MSNHNYYIYMLFGSLLMAIVTAKVSHTYYTFSGLLEKSLATILYLTQLCRSCFGAE